MYNSLNRTAKPKSPLAGCAAVGWGMTSLFAEQPNLQLKLAATLCRTVLKLGSSSSTSIAAFMLGVESSFFSVQLVSDPVMIRVTITINDGDHKFVLIASGILAFIFHILNWPKMD